MSFPSIVGLSNISQSERGHLIQIEEALTDVLLSSKLVAQTNGLDAHRIEGAIVSLLFAVAAKEAHHVIKDADEDEEIESCVHLAREAALWVMNRRRSLSDVGVQH